MALLCDVNGTIIVCLREGRVQTIIELGTGHMQGWVPGGGGGGREGALPL